LDPLRFNKPAILASTTMNKATNGVVLARPPSTNKKEILILSSNDEDNYVGK
jgi:hypothetical protein